MTVSNASGSTGAPIALNISSALTDTDGSETLSVRISGLPSSAVLSKGTKNADGTWTLGASQLPGLTVTVPSGTTQAFTLSVAATSTEAENGSTSTRTATLQLTLSGNNQPPVANADVASAQEDLTVTASGNVLTNDTDPNAGTVLSVASPGSFVGTYGTLVLNANGTYTYTLNNAASGVQALAAGQTVQDSFTYQAKDPQGAVSNTATLTVSVKGTNDTPTVTGMVTAAVNEDAAPLTVNLLAGASDVDTGAVLSVSGVSALPAGVTLSGTNLLVDAGNAAYQSLAQGATQVLTVTYNVVDQFGAAVAQTAKITITGTNDTPTVTGMVTAAVNEDAAPLTVNLLAGASDVDTGAVLSVSGVSALPAGVTLSGTNLLVNPADSAYQHLAAGVPQILTVSYNVIDGLGGMVAQTVQITVTGVNDAPTVTGIVTVAVAEDAAPITVNLLAGASDVDDGAVLHVANVDVLPAGVSLVGDSLVVNPADSAYQHLAAGVPQILTVSYNVIDGLGGMVAQTAQITITGMNDAPVAANDVVLAVEDTALVTSC